MTARTERVAGTGDLRALFADEAPITPVPWEQAGKRRTHATYDRELVRALLSTPPLAETFADLDPRDLRATQPSLTRAGVAYYLDDGYRRHGRTYADILKLGNKFPVVYRRDGQNLILSGHHRAAAAVLEGKPYRARVIDGPWGPPYGRDVDVISLDRAETESRIPVQDALVVTPSLLIGETKATHLQQLLMHHTRDALAVIVRAGDTSWMPFSVEHERIHDAMNRLAWDLPGWAEHQLHYAATGRIRFVE